MRSKFMTATRFWVLGLAAIAAISALALVLLRPADSSAAWVDAVAAEQRMQDAAYQAFRSGDASTAIPALAAYLRYLEDVEPLADRWEAGQNPWLDARALASERMIAAGRLAALLEQSGSVTHADALWARAVEYARQAGRPDVSIRSVKEAIYRSMPVAEPEGEPGHHFADP